jgi:20S proteasome subunit alpha 5
LACKILKQVMEEKLSATNIQMASVTAEAGYKLFNVQELQAVIDSL